MTDEQIKEILPEIPDDVAPELIAAAAEISDQPADDLTLEKALQILGDGWPEPVEYIRIVLNRYEKDKRRAAGGDPEQEAAERREQLLAEAMNTPAMQAVRENIREMQETLDYIQRATRPVADLARTAAAVGAHIAAASEAATRALESITRASMFVLPDWTNADEMDTLFSELDDISPYIDAVMQSRPEYSGITFNELLEPLPFRGLHNLITGTPAAAGDEYAQEINTVLDILQAARKLRQEADKVPALTTKKTNKVEYPLDKINSKVWGLFEKDTRGQIGFNLAPAGSKREILALYSIDFDKLQHDLGIEKRLLPFDKRVYIAAAALWNAGNDGFTITQIHHAMGNTSRPASDQVEKIDRALTKMQGAKIYLNNKQEADALKGREQFVYDGSLLPFERVRRIVNGQITDGVIHLFREPPLISFAKMRKQVTTIDVKLLQSPISKTDANLQIDDYLIERISKAKNPKNSRNRPKEERILYKTLYEHTGITTKKQKDRAPEKIRKYLEHYKKQGFISDFVMDDSPAGGITVYWGRPVKADKKSIV